MTIKLGPIDLIVTHYGSDALKPLCRHDETKPRTLSTSTTDAKRVTCKSCIEWMHS